MKRTLSQAFTALLIFVLLTLMFAGCSTPGTPETTGKPETTAPSATEQPSETACSHVWDDGIVTVEPGCAAEGVRTFTCTRCGETRQETVAASGHAWDDGVVTTEPTCAEEGVRTFTCTRCGETRQETIPALGHTAEEKTVLREPDCTSEGLGQFTCTRCGEVCEETIPALGHVWTLTGTVSEVESESNAHGTASFTCARCGEVTEAERCANMLFDDMPDEGGWSHEPIDWACFNGIAAGKTERLFCPTDRCTRAELVSFLWNCAGQPEPEDGTVSFPDVAQDDSFRSAALWAVENGFLSAGAENAFAPEETCTRAQVLSVLWRCCGSPASAGEENPFLDVKQDDPALGAILWAVKNGVTAGKTENEFQPDSVCTRAEVLSFLWKASRLEDDRALWSQRFPLLLGETDLHSFAFCRGNRIYVDLALVEAYFGRPEQETHWPLLERFGRTYITLADAAEQCRIGVVFRMEDGTVHLYHLAPDPWTVLEPTGDEKQACIRLEDLMADYGLNERFTHDHLIRVRTFGDYLQAKSDAFYLAWIPCYVNPELKVENNIAENFNFYNADFLFTMDSLILDGGRVILHGYTHADADRKSSSGYEFGSKNERTEEDMLDRFGRAQAIARSLGYETDMFEFPHYATTAFQRDVAERYFSVICQQYPDVDKKGYVETHQIGDHVCRWIPTPGDHVEGLSDGDRFCEELEKVKDKGQMMSFFFHPNVDTRFLVTELNGDVMTRAYPEDGKLVLPRVLRLLTEWGYRLGPF